MTNLFDLYVKTEHKRTKLTKHFNQQIMRKNLNANKKNNEARDRERYETIDNADKLASLETLPYEMNLSS